MRNILVLVDIQNDFITGSLANKDADKKTNMIAEFLKTQHQNFDGIVLTKDTHSENYLNTDEGKRLPIPHCIKGTDGHEIDKRIKILLDNYCNVFYIEKLHFMGDNDLLEAIFQFMDMDNCNDRDYVAITMCGFCTDICVVSNALLLKRDFPNITVIESLCSGTTKENHDAAIKVMKSCLIDIK